MKKTVRRTSVPPTRPSDHGKDRAEWWKDDDTDHEAPPGSDGKNTPDVNGVMREKQFDEEQREYKWPT